jgi:hypothetical protein
VGRPTCGVPHPPTQSLYRCRTELEEWNGHYAGNSLSEASPKLSEFCHYQYGG